MRFKIVVAVWNSIEWFEGCAKSILEQVEDYDVLVVDDASTDGTAELVEEICLANGWGFHLNSINRGVPCNHWYAIQALQPEPEDVLVFVDGDDQLMPGALSRLVYYYGDETTQLTYGQYRSVPHSPTCSLAGPYPDDVIQRRAYREHSMLGRGIPWNHLRTVRYDLFSQLTVDDFLDATGSFYRASADAVVMYPCLELAGDNFKFIPEPLYLYNSENPLSEWRKDPREGDKVHQHVLHRKPKVPVQYENTREARRMRLMRGLREQ